MFIAWNDGKLGGAGIDWAGVTDFTHDGGISGLAHPGPSTLTSFLLIPVMDSSVHSFPAIGQEEWK